MKFNVDLKRHYFLFKDPAPCSPSSSRVKNVFAAARKEEDGGTSRPPCSANIPAARYLSEMPHKTGPFKPKVVNAFEGALIKAYTESIKAPERVIYCR